MPKDCKAWKQLGLNKSGTYPVKPANGAAFQVIIMIIFYYTELLAQVYCDMETDGGGWTVFQRRQDGSINFNRGWVDYVNGFGNLTGEFWLGLNKIHRLTQEGSNTLRADLGDFNGNSRYAQYSTFSVGDNTTEYTLTIGGYSGTAGDGMSSYNGYRFATYDNDYNNCIQTWGNAGWWHGIPGCFYTILNGQYGQHISSWHGIYWYTWKGTTNLKFADMKSR